MRIVLLGLLAAMITACGSVEYKDSNAAVDANPLCVNKPDRPGEWTSPECERKAETIWTSDKPSKDSKPIDFSGKKD